MKQAATLLLGSLLCVAGCAPSVTGSGLPCNDDDDCGRGRHCALGTCQLGAPAYGEYDGGVPFDAEEPPPDAGAAAFDAGESADAQLPPEDAGQPVDDAGAAPLPSSCQELLSLQPEAASGLYLIEPAADGAALEVYCEMELQGGGWTRVVDLDAEAGDACPGEWLRAEPAEGSAVCHRHSDDISTATFEPAVAYTEVLGTALGLQYRSTDSFFPRPLDEIYLDGLSLTTSVGGATTHVWSFATGLSQTLSDHTEAGNLCPCSEGSTDTTPGWLGDDGWYCDSGSELYPDSDEWLTGDYLWDGVADDGACSTGTAPRWFTQTLPEETSAPLTARLMCDQPRTNEDVGVVRLELYVR